jgi:hypothetical protein
MRDICRASGKASVALVLAAFGVGCDLSRDTPGPSSSVPSSSSSASAASAARKEPSAAASAAPALAPPLAAIAAGSWKDPDGGPDIKLVSTPLDKCFGFKGYSLKLPEGSKIETLMGARACLAALPGAKKGYQLVVMSDEIKIDMPQKDKLNNVVEKTFDDPDAFLFKIDNQGKTSYTGWWEGKFGTVTMRCNAMGREGDEPYTFEVKRAVIELCRGLQHS